MLKPHQQNPIPNEALKGFFFTKSLWSAIW